MANFNNYMHRSPLGLSVYSSLFCSFLSTVDFSRDIGPCIINSNYDKLVPGHLCLTRELWICSMSYLFIFLAIQSIPTSLLQHHTLKASTHNIILLLQNPSSSSVDCHRKIIAYVILIFVNANIEYLFKAFIATLPSVNLSSPLVSLVRDWIYFDFLKIKNSLFFMHNSNNVDA